MSFEPGLERLAALAADGREVSWDEEARALPAEARRVANVLPALAQRARAHIAPALPRDTASLPLLARVLAAACLVRSAATLGILAAAAGAISAVLPTAGALGLLTLVFSGVAAILLYAGDRDPRALRLGAFFAVVSTAFATRPLLVFAEQSGLRAAGLVASLQPEAFVATAFGLFVATFPAVPVASRSQQAIDRLLALSAMVGAGLFLATATQPWLAPDGLASSLVRPLSRVGVDGRGPIFWFANFALLLAFGALALAKARSAAADERRRVFLFVLAVTLGLAPLVLLTLVHVAVPGAGPWIDAHEATTDALVYAGLLSLPLTTFVSVRGGQVLALRLLARRTLTYALARATLFGLLAVPLVALGALLYGRRDQPLGDALASGPAPALLAFAAAVAALRTVREPLLAAIDRLFSRNPAGAREALPRLLPALGAARGRLEVAQRLSAEARRSFGVRFAQVFQRSPAGAFTPLDGTGPALPAESALATLLGEEPAALSVDFAASHGLARLLPESERSFLLDLGLALLVPMSRTDGALDGFLALGPRTSEEAWDDASRQQAASLVAAAAVVMARWESSAEDAGPSLWDEEPAVECAACGRIADDRARPCACGSERFGQASLPRVALGKFRLTARIGAGGMGVVYAAEDLTLGRTVALKTLPRRSAEMAARMRSEARLMASIVHPAVATLFGAETWKGIPVLVVEHLPGGTLADRLARGPLSVADGVTLARTLAVALASLHARGVLHRDVKPSNVAFGAAGEPKLLDLGLARLLEAGSSDEGIAGTPLYLPPEAWAGAAPSAAWDVWALAVMLYESLAGRHPFARESLDASLDAIREAPLPELRQRDQAPPAWLSDLLASALEKAPEARRIRSADLFQRELDRR